jgi:hypothetical protein
VSDDPHRTVEDLQAQRDGLGNAEAAMRAEMGDAWVERLLAARAAYEEKRGAAEAELADLRETFFGLVREGVDELGRRPAEVGRLLGLTRQRIHEILGGVGSSLGRPWRK